jgi:dTDP-4-dehydrorhamnose 3,5-epimerase
MKPTSVNPIEDCVAGMLGVRLKRLTEHADDRGSVTELFRNSWEFGIQPVQWNIVKTNAGVMRGVHVHLERHDLLTVLHGKGSIGLRDIRRNSASYGKTHIVHLSGDELSVLTVPPGIVHGFYSDQDSIFGCAFSADWDPSDDYGCRWDDAELGIPWADMFARCSEKDMLLPSFKELMAQLPDYLG